jgi:alpha-tubulin suppressor-like RCC1 family protein
VTSLYVTLFLTDTGYVYGTNKNLTNDPDADPFGFNNEISVYGDLGSSVFIEVDTGVSDIAVGRNHAVLLKGGAVYTAGSNDYGQLGNGSTTGSRSWIAVGGVGSSGVTAVYAGGRCTFISKSGTLYACGYNAYGQLGISSTTTSITTLTACTGAGTSGVNTVSCGHYNTLILKSGVVYGAGRNVYGEVGDNTTTQRTGFTIGAGVASSGVSKICCTSNSNASGGSSYIIKSGKVYAVGRNQYGQLGVGDAVDKTVWTAVLGQGTSGVDDIYSGGNQACIRKADVCYSTGSNTYGQLGDGTNVSRSQFLAVSASASSGVTMLPDCGGDNWYGSLVLKGNSPFGCGLSRTTGIGPDMQSSNSYIRSRFTY